ncbi:hypothetical protein PENTCL1PPCAC_26385, partial [Pristionchus entomophagus]
INSLKSTDNALQRVHRVVCSLQCKGPIAAPGVCQNDLATRYARFLVAQAGAERGSIAARSQRNTQNPVSGGTRARTKTA